MEENFRVIELPDEVTAHAFLVNRTPTCAWLLFMMMIYLIMKIWLLKYKNETYTESLLPYNGVLSPEI
ncbi:hypothetical protein TIFTF001_032745 [Ficus carica]|uniref:Uncharacterized protein n=1 Tax=Ficus carica TaxID=3494 RepID=A0AA88DYX6_FICCA|nr:hypothetical protein TIFTF001_032663 [Ficus carica]GMN63651.1 hypothetical protein TIFTF001_032745 [Ficus carica]